MTIDRKRHVDRRSHKRPGESGGPLMLNIRVRHLRKKGSRPTDPREVVEALQYLLDHHEMPRGWQFMVVNWKNPRKFGSDWQSGWPSHAESGDVDQFLDDFTHAVQAKIRMAEVWRVDL